MLQIALKTFWNFYHFQEQEKERKKRLEAEKANRGKNLVDMSSETQEGVLDGLMEALKTGSAFRDPSRPARKKKNHRSKIH